MSFYFLIPFVDFLSVSTHTPELSYNSEPSSSVFSLAERNKIDITFQLSSITVLPCVNFLLDTYIY